MTRLSSIVKNGLCIGCGLCETLSSGAITMEETVNGSLRPHPLPDDESAIAQKIAELCPGANVKPRFATDQTKQTDLVWGNLKDVFYAWAADPTVRNKSATGGVLTALGMFLLQSKQIEFVLHVGAKPNQPMRNQWYISETPQQVLDRTASRYGPVAPLAGLEKALERQQPFAIIAKPCDLNGVDNLAEYDSRVDKYCLYRLAMVCGGQSKLSKSANLLKEFAVEEAELTTFRYRGYGNPGPTYVKTKSGDEHTISYLEFWEDESGWDLETRCKICPDPLGESADIAALDVWPGGAPSGEDEGFNGVTVRSQVGEKLIKSAVASDFLVKGDALTTEQLNDFQPHQVRKKYALKSRFDGMKECDMPIIDAPWSRLETLTSFLEPGEQQKQRRATIERVKNGNFK